MPRIHIAHELSESLPERLAADGVQLATLDLDKVLAPYGKEEVYPDAPDFVNALRTHGITPIIATNSHNVARLDAVKEQLGDITILHRGIEGMRPKPHPAMLLAARAIAGSGGRAIHIDDQFKAYFAARRAGFDSFVWLKPRGSIFIDHPATVALRALEVPVYASLLIARTVQSIT